MVKVLIIGLGEIGYANAKYLHSLDKPDVQVFAHDIRPAQVAKGLHEGIIDGVVNELKDLEEFDVYMVCVPTHDPADIFKPYLQPVFDVLKRIREHGKRDGVVALESTVPVGTCSVIGDLLDLDRRIHLVHCPERWYKQEQDQGHGIKQPRVIGAWDQCCMKAGKAFYEDMMHIPLFEVPSLEVAEATKIIENADRFKDIAWAEEVKMWCDQLGIQFSTVRHACNTKWNIDIKEARDGIGGHCLKKDSMLYLESGKTVISMIKAAIDADNVYKKRLQTNLPEISK